MTTCLGHYFTPKLNQKSKLKQGPFFNCNFEQFNVPWMNKSIYFLKQKPDFYINLNFLFLSCDLEVKYDPDLFYEIHPFGSEEILCAFNK